MDKVEIELDNKSHTCTGHVMCDEETGRTIASFWHESDIVGAYETINSHEEMKALLSLAWGAIQEAGYEDHCIGLGEKIENILSL